MNGKRQSPVRSRRPSPGVDADAQNSANPAGRGDRVLTLNRPVEAGDVVRHGREFVRPGDTRMGPRSAGRSGRPMLRSTVPAAGHNRPDRSPVAMAKIWYLTHAPTLVAALAAVLGVLSLADALWHRHERIFDWLTPILPIPARAAAEAIIAVSGVLLLRIAAALRKRKRAAWRIAVLICLAMGVAHVARGAHRPAEAAVTITLLVALLTLRSRYTARSDAHNRWFAVRVLGQLLVVAVGYGMVWLAVPGQVVGRVSIVNRAREVIGSLVGLGGYLKIRDDRFADVFHATMLSFGLVTLCCVTFLVLRASEPAAVLSRDDEARLRRLLDADGWRDSLGYFALRRDKSVVWSATGKAAIAYRVVAGVALASGDPIGDPEAWPGAIAAYRRLVESFAWTPAVMGCSERGAMAFQREYDLSALALGDEAVLTAPDFSLDGRAMRGIRQACRRLEREAYQVRVRRMTDLEPAEVAEMRSAAERWRGDAVERGFSMALSRIGDPDDRHCVVVTAHQSGQLRGLLHLVPWGCHGLSLDLMRRDRDAANGLNDLMIAELMRSCKSVGITEVSLNFAAFRDPLERGERIGAGPLLRARRRLLLVASRWWQIDSLYRFNAKFQPCWRPRFVSFPSVRDLPRIAFAAMEAEAFIVRPRRLNRLLGRT